MTIDRIDRLALTLEQHRALNLTRPFTDYPIGFNDTGRSLDEFRSALFEDRSALPTRCLAPVESGGSKRSDPGTAPTVRGPASIGGADVVKSNAVDVVCPCGATFKAIPSRIADGKGKYCSRTCWLNYRPLPSAPKVDLICDLCGAAYQLTERRLANRGGASRFCSAICRQKGRDWETAGATTHGLSKHPEYQIWKGMRKRCNNPNALDWEYYGGRGISVCPEWDDFETFQRDMGSRPSSEMSIDRIDSDGNYEPGNCRWADAYTQNNNRRPTTRKAKP